MTVHKTAQGLGLSVTGGVAPSIPVVDNCSWPGLIRIKKIFVHGAAWQTGKLAVGDVLLAVNGVPLTGSTNYVSSLSLSLSLFSRFFSNLVSVAESNIKPLDLLVTGVDLKLSAHYILSSSCLLEACFFDSIPRSIPISHSFPLSLSLLHTHTNTQYESNHHPLVA